jgi:hypothetical protein
MSGCRNAIAARNRYRERAAACPALAYDLHLQGERCRRLGGPRQCGACAGDILPLGVPRNAMPLPLSGVNEISAAGGMRPTPKNASESARADISEDA